MVLIADGGSTKSDWNLVQGSQKLRAFHTEGYNPYFVDTASIVDSMLNSLPKDIARSQILKVYYYGAGCSSPEKVRIVSKAMEHVFPGAEVFVGHDLLAACRALLGNHPGFAAILGTGTNSCLYDGNDITMNIDSLGYFLGDEGSGSFIGKRLLRDYMRGYLPAEIHKNFVDQFGLSREDIFNVIYNKPLPNRFLASFSKFVYEHISFDYSQAMVKDGFRAFFDCLVTRYPDYPRYAFNCIGSVAFNFKDILEQVCHENDMEVGRIVRSPIDSLVDFHIARLS